MRRWGLLLAVPLALAGCGGGSYSVARTAACLKDKGAKINFPSTALGSFVLTPLGLAAAGPVAQAAGTRETMLGAAALSLGATLAVLLSRDVRTIRRRDAHAD